MILGGYQAFQHSLELLSNAQLKQFGVDSLAPTSIAFAIGGIL